MIQDYLKLYNVIDKISFPKCPFDGNYLKNRGIKEGAAIGKILKLLKEEWINNNFKVSDQKILKIIESQSD